MIGIFLRDLQAECGGSIPFEKFMEAALYHPEFGYYSARLRTVGRAGDFSTWPGLHPSLANAIAAWLHRYPSDHIIEAGAGSGELAAGVLRQLGFFARLRTTCHIVEISPALREEQEKRLKGQRVVWHSDMNSALAAANGRASIFSNEFPDAFPCRVFVRSESRWKELALTVDGGSAREILREAVLPESSSLECNPPDGSRVEVHESYRRWMQSWSAAWKQGAMLTVDYGGTMPELYHRRPAGTLRAYARHQRLSGADVYSAFGRRDLTADVNFTDLQAWGENLGWETISHCPLPLFLKDFSPKIRLPESFAIAGAAFRVFQQTRS